MSGLRCGKPPTIPGRRLAPEVITSLQTPTVMRHRREASYRLPPLRGGHRDPLDDLAGQPTRQRERCHGAEFDGTSWRPCCRGAA